VDVGLGVGVRAGVGSTKDWATQALGRSAHPISAWRRLAFTPRQ
jgi:hypothetical protein